MRSSDDTLNRGQPGWAGRGSAPRFTRRAFTALGSAAAGAFTAGALGVDRVRTALAHHVPGKPTAELELAASFAHPATWQRAAAIEPAVRVKRIGRGEAECAAVAVTRGLTLWSDDAAIVVLVAALHPGHPVERISDLLARAVREGLMACEEAADLYNGVFKGVLGLWTGLTLVCHNDQVAVQ